MTMPVASIELSAANVSDANLENATRRHPVEEKRRALEVERPVVDRVGEGR
jgi:hypothetical protein